MNDDERGRLLLSGPRGRRLCFELLGAGAAGPPTRFGRHAAQVPYADVRPAAVAELRAALRRTDLESVRRPDHLAAALARSVDRARYWQEPDDEDAALADDVVAAELAPIAEAVVRAPASRWWVEPVDGADQHVVGWPFDGVIALPEAVPDGLARWRADTVAGEAEAQRNRRRDVRADVSGGWWSTPPFAGLLCTARSRPRVTAGARDRAVPVGLSLVEDGMDWPTARTWPVQVPAGARIYEITGPDAWTALVARHPLEVTASRRRDWWLVTGWDGRWFIPDWAAVAARFDAVHVTVDGYLSTAGRALPVEDPSGPAATLLAGFDPDATWWLTDVRTGLGEPTDWRGDHDRQWGDDRYWEPAD